MRVYPDLTHARLYEVLDYNPVTGIWVWKRSTGYRAKVGTQAGCISTKTKNLNIPYRLRIITIDRHSYVSARLAWFYMNGEWPPKGYEVDHINNDPLDDRWENLRLATSSQGKANRRAKGKTGYKGVDYHKASGLFRARVGPAKAVRSLGYYKTEEEAYAVASKAAEEMWGEFANVVSMPTRATPMKYDIPIQSDGHAQFCKDEAVRRYGVRLIKDHLGMWLVEDENGIWHTDDVLRALSRRDQEAEGAA